MSRKFISQDAKAWIKPLSVSIWTAEKNLDRFHQESRYYKLCVKKTDVVFEQRDFSFK